MAARYFDRGRGDILSWQIAFMHKIVNGFWNTDAPQFAMGFRPEKPIVG
jgi:hypothetical protein